MRQKPRQDVFTDLGFAPAGAENLRIRSAMMRALVAFIRKEKLTQAQAAKLLGVTQPRVSDLMRGKIHLFSIDNLVVLLAAAGLRVDVKVKKAALDISDEAYCIAKAVARDQNRSLGRVVGDLILRSSKGAKGASIKMSDYGFPTFHCARPVTTEDVKALDDQE